MDHKKEKEDIFKLAEIGLSCPVEVLDWLLVPRGPADMPGSCNGWLGLKMEMASGVERVGLEWCRGEMMLPSWSDGLE